MNDNIIYDLFKYWMAKLGLDSHFDTKPPEFQAKKAVFAGLLCLILVLAYHLDQMKESLIIQIMKGLNSNKIKNINDVIDIVLGDKFLVAHKKNGVIEVYDNDFNLLSSNQFTNVEKVNANSRVLLIRKNGTVDFFDKWLNFEFSKKPTT